MTISGVVKASSHGFIKRSHINRAKWLVGASALVFGSAAAAAPQLILNNVGNPTTQGSGQGERAIWTNAGSVGGETVDIVGIVTSATQDHNWTTTSSRPSITSGALDDVFIEWHLYRAGTYNIATNSGGVPVTADIHVQFNDVDGPNNERVYAQVCSGDIKWVRIDAFATTGRAFGTIAGRDKTFSLIGDKNYSNQPESGVEIFWPNRSSFSMGRTANSGFLIRLDNPTYSEFDTLDFECADFTPPNAVDDSKEGTPGSATTVQILDNDSSALNNNNPTNNNLQKPSEFARDSVNLVPPAGATNIVRDAKNRVTELTVPGEGRWAYNKDTGGLTFTPDPSFRGVATTVDYTFTNALGIPSDPATVTVWYPGIGVTKSSTFNDENGDGFMQVGETISYVYLVRSYGVEALRNPAISETGFTGAGTAPVPTYQSGDVNTDGYIDLTESWTYHATYALVAADLATTGVANSATATGATAAGTVVSDISDSSNPGDGNGSAYSGPGPNNGDPTRTAIVKKPIAAANDSQSGTIFVNVGLPNAYNIFGNDTLNGVAATLSNVTLSVVTPATHAGVALDPASGQVSVAPGTPAGTYSIAYKICEIGNPSNCAQATASIVVTAVTPIAASVDSPAPVISAVGGSAIINALTNDSLGGNPPAIADVTLTVVTPASHPGVTLDPVTGLVSVVSGTPAGTYSIEYRICEKANSANCAASMVNVTVSPNPIAAANDAPSPVVGAAGDPALINAFLNDTLNGSPVDPSDITARVTTAATPASPGAPIPALDASTGTVSVPPGTPAGTYVIGYEICEKADPDNCRNAAITIVVTAASIAAANDSTAAVTSGSGGTALVNVLGNDSLAGAQPTPATIDLTVVTPATHPGVTLDGATGLVKVEPGTPAGNYVIAYKICEKLNSTNCAIANVTVPVLASPISASNDDAGTVTTAIGGANLVDALVNDQLNGAAVVLADVDLTVTTPASRPGVTLDVASGRVSVAAGTPAGTYIIGYRICEKANPSNCANASIAVVIAETPLGAANDAPPPVNGREGSPNGGNVFDNDSFNGQPVDPAIVTVTVPTPATPIRPGAPVPALDPNTGIIAVPPGTPAGTYTIGYSICETANPSNCATANAVVVVAPAPILATPDNPAPVNGANGGEDIVNAFANDRLNGSPIDVTEIIATIVTPATPARPGASVPVLDPATGLVNVPAGTPSGSYTIEYSICEKLNPTNCATSSVTVQVEASVIHAGNDDAGSVSGIAGGGNLVNVLTNDRLNAATPLVDMVTIAVTTAASHPGVTLDPATGNVAVAPGTPAGSYSIGYSLCEALNSDNCATATVVVVVSAAPIAAAPDTPAPVNGAKGGTGIVNVFDNDRFNDQPIDPAKIEATIVTPATPATPGASVPVFDPATGLVDVPPGTPAGSYHIAYRICETLNPDNCATSNVTIVVEAPDISADADNPAPVRGGIGNPHLINAFANDRLNGSPIDAAAITATVVNAASHPGVVLDPATGNVAVGTDVPAGTYVIDYRICETLNPSNCANSRVTVVVEPALSSLEGTVFTDMNRDGVLDPDEPRRAGWIVEIVRDGKVIGTAVTDGNGDYRVEGLVSGPDHEIRFRNPQNNVVYNVLKDVELTPNANLGDMNQPIDPSGVIYDSITRQPIPGATTVLTDRNGDPLPSICFVDPSQASQVTGTGGEYRFDIVPGAAPQCPAGETVYKVVVTPPPGYSDGSTVLTPRPGPFDPSGLIAPVRINPDPTPPSGSNPPFYLEFRLESGDPDVINNHIALDPFLTRTALVVTKTSIKRTASVGDIVPYEITVRNNETAQRAGVTVVDILPPGTKYVVGSSAVNGAAQEPVTSDRKLEWRNQTIPANGSVRYNLAVVIGAGVTGGEKVNTGVAENGADGVAISNRGTAVVSIVPSAVFDCSELLGKVFEDRNRNGYQDKGEPGVPGARLATVNGQLVTTDAFGRYHIACAAVPDARIGSNFVLKLDTRTLPLGWAPTTDNPRSIRLTRGKFGELNFGVAPQESAEKHQEKGE